MIANIDLSIWAESKIHNEQPLFIHQVQNVLSLAFYNASLQFSKVGKGCGHFGVTSF